MVENRPVKPSGWGYSLEKEIPLLNPEVLKKKKKKKKDWDQCLNGETRGLVWLAKPYVIVLEACRHRRENLALVFKIVISKPFNLRDAHSSL